MVRKAGQGKEEEESRARQQEEKTPVRDEEKTPARHGGGHHVVEQDCHLVQSSERLPLAREETDQSLISNPSQYHNQYKIALGNPNQDCSLKIQEPDVPAPWFLDPGGWGKTAVSLYFIFPGICTLSLNPVKFIKSIS
ncbi:hypothetical protein STEG23_016813, partial [Scotinomys teguina]